LFGWIDGSANYAIFVPPSAVMHGSLLEGMSPVAGIVSRQEFADFLGN
jgi:hypothetical protein